MSHLPVWTRAMIPPGHHFLPTDVEIIESYLLRWSKGLPLPVNDLILEADIYGPRADPHLVFPDTTDPRWDFVSEKPSPDGTIITVKRVAYVLTKLSKINRDKTRIARRAGPGKWNGQTCPREIHDERQLLIGCMRMFTYEPSIRERREAGDHWIMHEYSLAGASLDDERLKHTKYVILDENNAAAIVVPFGYDGAWHGKSRMSSDVNENNTDIVLPFDDATDMEHGGFA
ncbi:Unknown protein [Striga hermonthica]|uniref:NAC domain-containing protein n=1 Tax=Striga hermonthica TaxID=68872 RepID=A0A9N7NSA0_STRHE|nr:Unknown protein [Striga hermonthica]